MTALYITRPFDDSARVGLINLYYNTVEAGNTIFTNKLPKDFSLSEITFVPSMSEADYVLIPQPVRRLTPAVREYVNEVCVEAAACGKQVIIFIGGDLSHDVFIDSAIVLKGSQYGYLMRPNEIIVPPFAEDLGEDYGLVWRTKHEKPVVGFCGWAGFQNLSQRIKYVIKNVAYDLYAVTGMRPHAQLHKKGLYYRRRAMRALESSSLVDTKFIVRNSFSANATTISVDPAVARKEYVDVLQNSDFALAPKGDGNFSVRFFEALSLGRIPVLIDTDCTLPFAGEVDYDSFIVRIPYTEIDSAAQKISEVYHGKSQDEFIAMQHAARAAYDSYLRYDTFFNHLFGNPQVLAAAARAVRRVSL